MPIWLRKFTFEKLKKYYEPEDDDKLEEGLKKAARQSAQDEIGKKPEVTVIISRLSA